MGALLREMRRQARSGSAFLADGVRADARGERRDLLGSEHLTGRRPAQVGVGVVALQAQSHLTDRLWRRSLAEGPLAVEAEVDVEGALVVEVDEQVLAERIGFADRGAVEQGGAIGEASLRAAHRDWCPLEGATDAPGLAMDDVTFGHGR